MIEFLSGAPFALAVVSVVIALFLLMFGGLSAELRPAVGVGLLGALLGFLFGSLSQGGFNQTTGIGLGAVAALLFGLGGAGAGFLVGFGLVCFSSANSRVLGCSLIIVGLALPLATVADKTLRPRLVREKLAWWDAALAAGLPEQARREASRHLSYIDRAHVRAFLESEPGRRLPETTLSALDDLDLLAPTYNPMPAALAWRMYRRNPKSAELAANYSIPDDLMHEMSRSPDLDLITVLAGNRRLPLEVQQELRARLMRLIEAEKAKPHLENRDIYRAQECLHLLDQFDNPAPYQPKQAVVPESPQPR